MVSHKCGKYETGWSKCGSGDMKQGGVGVGMVSHKYGKYEIGWSRCGKKKGRVRMKTNCNKLGCI